MSASKTAKTILIAEDAEGDAALLHYTLKAAGINNPTVTVSDGVDVIAYLSGAGKFSNRGRYPLPTVLLLDLKMPRMDGLQVLEWIGRHPELKPPLVVALTGFQEYKEADKAYQLGANTFLTKPCTTEDIENLRLGFKGFWDSAIPPQSGGSGSFLFLM